MIRLVRILILRGLFDLRHSPWAQALTLASVMLISLLGGLFLLFVHNLDAELMRTRGDVVFQAYWDPSEDLQHVEAQWEQLRGLDYLKDMVTYTPDQGLLELSHGLGSDIDLSWVQGDQSLPATALLFFSPPDQDHALWTEQTLNALQSLPGVREVHYNPLRTDLANSWARNGKRIVWPLCFFLALVLSLIIGNTIKLAMLERREEIEILHLVGAKPWYIQLPLVVSGFAHGLCGSTLALILLKLLQMAARDVLDFPPLFLRISFFTLDQCLIMIFVVTLIGMASSHIAVKRLSSPRRPI